MNINCSLLTLDMLYAQLLSAIVIIKQFYPKAFTGPTFTKTHIIHIIIHFGASLYLVSLALSLSVSPSLSRFISHSPLQKKLQNAHKSH